MALYKLLKNSTRGRKGEVVELHGDIVRQLKTHGIIGEPYREPETRKVVEPEVRKVVEPEVKKTRKKRASKATK